MERAPSRTAIWAEGALPFLDDTVGLVQGRAGAFLVDTGTKLAQAAAIDADVRQISGRGETCCLKPQALLRYGADAGEIDRAIAVRKSSAINGIG